MTIKIIKAGLLTTIQDLGRHTYRQYGIASNGALDSYSHQIANWLVGKSKTSPTLEVTQLGPTLEFTQPMSIGISGAEFELFVNDTPQPMNTTLHLKAGDVLQFGKLHFGARAYIAFAGQLEKSCVMGSFSTNLLAEFGGYKGRALKDGDEVAISSKTIKNTRVTPSELLQELHHNLQQKHVIVRITKGREDNLLTEQSARDLFEGQFKVSSYSNRMALTLESQPINLSQALSMTTVPVTTGTIQLPDSGRPIVTLADGQTTGGYPRIGQVISADLNLLGQLKAQETISFYRVSIDHALKILEDKQKYFNETLHS